MRNEWWQEHTAGPWITGRLGAALKGKERKKWKTWQYTPYGTNTHKPTHPHMYYIYTLWKCRDTRITSAVYFFFLSICVKKRRRMFRSLHSFEKWLWYIYIHAVHYNIKPFFTQTRYASTCPYVLILRVIRLTTSLKPVASSEKAKFNPT